MKKITFVLILSICTSFLNAEVYLKYPARRADAGRSPLPSELPGMSSKAIMTEPVRVNGVDLNIEIFQAKTTLRELELRIRNRFSPSRFEKSTNYLFAVFGKERWLFVSAGIDKPASAFLLKLPGKLPAAVWPASLPPLPPGTFPEMIIEMKKRRSVCGTFSGAPADARILLQQMTARLNSMQWIAAGAEAAPGIRGNGEIFIRSNPKQEILWISFTPAGGAFYYKAL